MRALAILLFIFGSAGCDLGTAHLFDDWDTVVHGGEPQSGDEAVALLTPGCTAELIAQSDGAGGIAAHSEYFLTAAHCVRDGVSQTLGFGVAPDTSNGAALVGVAAFVTHPQHDLAIGRLAQPVPVPGMVLNATDVDTEYQSGVLAEVMRTVGYGTVDSSTGFGQKRSGPLAFVRSETRRRGDLMVMSDRLGAMMCQGDSGGLLVGMFDVAGEAVPVMVGVNSAITGLTCSEPGTQGLALRIDRYVGFVSDTMAQTGRQPVLFSGLKPPERPPAPTAPAPGPATAAPAPQPSRLGGCAAGHGKSSLLLLLLAAGLTLVLRRP